ncbi:glycoside hydrolase family 31 protein [Fulvivirgaceae bacterium BMA12]|uniref:Glycoside hydrolase family 31 protein n=1 Tax=Agaribacillus aureus TaxID=3051825 RepID=A0ABT8LG12_9BACT|nr:glycoside hydrolase family 31 protein [Fulvivirgaceae bacterium BMA12]
MEKAVEPKKTFEGNYIENFSDKKDGEFYPSSIANFYQDGQAFYFEAGDTTLELKVYSEKIIRFRYANFELFEDDFSYGVDDNFQPEKVAIDFKEEPEHFLVATPEVKCLISKKDLRTKILNKDNQVIQEDEKGYHWMEEKSFGGNVVISTKKLQQGENFYGLGDKPGNLNLRGKVQQLWGTDFYGFQKDSDPIYKNIPFYLGLHHNIGYGLFMDNTFRSFFDFGKERQNVYSFWAQGGEMRYYFIYGPDLLDVCRSFTTITGKPELPPMWALGYHQSKWSYYPEKVVRDLGSKFRKKKIPCDVIHLDIDYMDGFRCFTWNKDHFPDPANMIGDLAAKGFKTVVIVDPGIKIDKDYWVYKEGIKHDYFCKGADGSNFRGSVWPGLCHFPDFTNPEVRTWWSGLFEGLVNEGVVGVWNDMNEPAVFEEGTFPFHVRHDYDGHPCSHRKAHNVYGMQMAKATYMGQKKFLDNKRPFNITRSAYAGVQRYACVWTGDNVATWEHLKIANRQCQRLSVSGISFAGSDVGGFIESSDGELYTRWIQMATFHPFFRTHSSGDHGDKEPWTFGEKYEKIVKKYIEFRYQLLPHLYTAFWQYATYGTPIIRSLHMLNQVDSDTYHRKEEFAMGDNILVCPISSPGAEGRWLYLPKETWYNFWTDELLTDAGEVWVDAPLEIIPFFVKAGAVLALNPVMHYVGEFPVAQLNLHVYHGTVENKSTLYEDKGDGYEYKDQDFKLKQFSFSGEKKSLTLKQEVEGNYNTSYNTYLMTFHGVVFEPRALSVDGEPVNFKFDKAAKTCVAEVKHDFTELVLS